jgi:flavorubredoxin
MFSFDHATGVMFTCDAFGAHYATDAPFDTELQALAPHFRFYYDCLMRPNARSVLTALRKVKDLPYSTIATGHGPIIRYNLEELVGRCVMSCTGRAPWETPLGEIAE